VKTSVNDSVDEVLSIVNLKARVVVILLLLVMNCIQYTLTSLKAYRNILEAVT